MTLVLLLSSLLLEKELLSDYWWVTSRYPTPNFLVHGRNTMWLTSLVQLLTKCGFTLDYSSSFNVMIGNKINKKIYIYAHLRDVFVICLIRYSALLKIFWSVGLQERLPKKCLHHWEFA